MLLPIPPSGYFLTRWREKFNLDPADGIGSYTGTGLSGICARKRLPPKVVTAALRLRELF